MTIDVSTIVTVVPSVALIGSGILNWVQYRSSKRGTELGNFEKQLEVLEKLQDLKDEKYQAALKTKDLEIAELKKQLQEVRDRDILPLKLALDKNTQMVTVLQTAVNKLIGGGCKRTQCQQRIPYPIEELGNMLGLVTDKVNKDNK